MQVGVTVEIICPLGSVSWQSQVAVQPESIRGIRKELLPQQSWTWKRLNVPINRLAVFAVQAQHPATLQINGSDILLEGQFSTDFGIAFARRGAEVFGNLPFGGDEITELTVVNRHSAMNRVDIYLAELEDEEVPHVTGVLPVDGQEF